MDLTPRHIQEKQFHDTFRGYSHEEVDLFLDEVAEAFEKVFRENQQFHHRLRKLEEDLGSARSTEDMLKRTLITAQRTAEEAVEEAKSKAQGMIVAAERRAQEMVAGAERKAQEIVADAHQRERELQVRIEGLKRFDQEYRARLRAFIESQLNVLAEGPAPAGTAPVQPDVPAAPSQSPETPGAAITATQTPREGPGEAEAVAVARTSKPVRTAAAGAGAAGSEPRERVSGETRAARPAGVTRPSGPAGTSPQQSEPAPPVRSPQSGEARPASPADRNEDEDDDDATIKKLFWGDD